MWGAVGLLSLYILLVLVVVVEEKYSEVKAGPIDEILERHVESGEEDYDKLIMESKK